ncbi:DUF2207 domain-containing protein [Calidifontibacter sp. DB0510]|uniref:DUF2207 domain-containing protein n=1 Tax=Metallococcus carri TaxID=1656884 RepID=A0A967AXA9_9MICO|nr:DUF2207 domain-containing protein [Metallococcus carri]NHN54704.1 DUF2207 domain-containing protein [Metallococcus carri]NOP37049.1 DUF2207 domain-containing protein [Calidifontibacter sp. DB2511S]
MTKLDTESIAIGVGLLILAILVVSVLARRRRDQEYVGLTPGLEPVDPRSASVRRVRGGVEWKGQVAPQFSPPRGMGPAVAGTIIDGSVDSRDLAAMLVDLSLRGWYRLQHIGPPGKGKGDWVFHQAAQPPSGDRLSPAEQRMLSAIFAGGPQVSLAGLRPHLKIKLREVQIDLYREMIQRGWYRDHPRSRNGIPALIGVLLIPGAAVLAWVAYTLQRDQGAVYAWALPAGALAAAIVLITFGRGRTPRTASGTAARIQVLGFREYLATAEADQIKFEEAANLLPRYLPFALAFGLADRWAKLVRDVQRDAQLAGYGDLTSGWDSMPDLFLFTDFASDATSLFVDGAGCIDGCDGCDGLDGCDGCDGCDGLDGCGGCDW